MAKFRALGESGAHAHWLHIAHIEPSHWPHEKNYSYKNRLSPFSASANTYSPPWAFPKSTGTTIVDIKYKPLFVHFLEKKLLKNKNKSSIPLHFHKFIADLFQR
jgi:hypothetical protein